MNRIPFVLLLLLAACGAEVQENQSSPQEPQEIKADLFDEVTEAAPNTPAPSNLQHALANYGINKRRFYAAMGGDLVRHDGQNERYTVTQRAGEQIIHLPAGIFRIPLELYQLENITLIGAERGTYFLIPHNHRSVLTVKHCTNITIENIGFKHFSGSSCGGNTVDLINSDNVTIKNCYINGSGVQGVSMEDCSSVVVEHNFIENCQWSAVQDIASHSIVKNNLIINPLFLTLDHEEGFDISFTGNTCVQSAQHEYRLIQWKTWSTKTQVKNNTFYLFEDGRFPDGMRAGNTMKTKDEFDYAEFDAWTKLKIGAIDWDNEFFIPSIPQRLGAEAIFKTPSIQQSQELPYHLIRAGRYYYNPTIDRAEKIDTAAAFYGLAGDTVLTTRAKLDSAEFMELIVGETQTFRLSLDSNISFLFSEIHPEIRDSGVTRLVNKDDKFTLTETFSVEQLTFGGLEAIVIVPDSGDLLLPVTWFRGEENEYGSYPDFKLIEVMDDLNSDGLPEFRIFWEPEYCDLREGILISTPSGEYEYMPFIHDGEPCGC